MASGSPRQTTATKDRHRRRQKGRDMQAALIIFMVIAALATLGVLARGIIIMARGKDLTGQQSNKMMSYRVAFQFLAIVFIVILFLLNRQA
jgi:hypothetical protein